MSRRTTGRYEGVRVDGRDLSAFVPHPLPPSAPALAVGPRLRDRLAKAHHALEKLELAGELATPSEWLADVLVRREAVLSAQLAGVGAKVGDLLAFEADEFAIPSADVADARHVLDAFTQARARLIDPKGPSLTQRALCDLHRIVLRGDESAGRFRQSPVWIGAKRPEGAVYVPPSPPDAIDALHALETYIADRDDLPPLLRVGLVHVQIASIHPFADGNGRIARLILPALLERWGVLRKPLLCLSGFLRENRQEYYRRVDAVRTAGDWEGWSEFFLDAVAGAADDSAGTTRDLVARIATDRVRVLRNETLSAASVRLFELLPRHPLLTVAAAMKLLDASKPTAGRAVETLVEAGVLAERTGRKRDRWFGYAGFLDRIEG